MAESGAPVPVAGWAEIRQLLQEQHDRVAKCFDECMSGNDKILNRLLAYQDGNGATAKVEGATAGLCVIPASASGNNARFNDGLAKLEPWQNQAKKEVTNASPMPAANPIPTNKTSHEVQMQLEDTQLREAARRSCTSSLSAPTGTPASGFRRCVRSLVNNDKFESLIAVAIVTSATLLGVETQYMAANLEDKAPMEFKFLSWIHAFIFLVELILRLICEGTGFFIAIHWAWNWFDVLLVIISVAEVIFDVLALATDVDNQDIVRVARILRAFRLSRIIRITRIVRFVSALHIMIQSIIGTLRSLVWILVLMTMILYVCGIMFTQAATAHLVDALDAGREQNNVDLVEYWGTLPSSMFTLYKSVTGGISWHEVVLPLAQMSWVWVALFVIYVSFIYFAVLNVVTGFFCNSAIEHAKHEPEMLIHSQIKDQAWHESNLKKLFFSLDDDQSHHIDIRELDEKLQLDEVRAWFAAMGLEIQDAWTLFKLIDEDQSHDVSVPEFVTRCMHLRGHARSIDLEQLRHDHKVMSKKVWEMEGRISDQLMADRRILKEDMHRIEQYMVSISADLTRPE